LAAPLPTCTTAASQLWRKSSNSTTAAAIAFQLLTRRSDPYTYHSQRGRRWLRFFRPFRPNGNSPRYKMTTAVLLILSGLSATRTEVWYGLFVGEHSPSCASSVRNPKRRTTRPLNCDFGSVQVRL